MEELEKSNYLEGRTELKFKREGEVLRKLHGWSKM